MMEKIKKVLISLKKRDFVLFLEYFFRLLGKIGISISLDFLYVEDISYSQRAPDPDFKLTVWNRHNFPGSIPFVDQNQYKIFYERIKLGNSAYVIEHKGKIIGYRWISTDKKIYPQEKILKYFPENTIYCYDALIAPEFRGKGLWSLFVARTAQDYRTKDFKMVSVSSIFNKSAQRAKEKANAKKKDLILGVKLFNRWEATKKLKSYPSSDEFMKKIP
jgi:GNAT superfamily N-acetyltransferase